jgi:ABC-type antimicrobial peptide transport system permease subunit
LDMVGVETRHQPQGSFRSDVCQREAGDTLAPRWYGLIPVQMRHDAASADAPQRNQVETEMDATTVAVDVAKAVLEAPSRIANSWLPWWPEQVSDTFTIVGVVGDIKESRLDDPVEPVMYWSYLQNATRYTHLLVKTKSTPTSVTSLVQQEIRSVDPDLGVYDAQSMESALDRVVATPRLNSVLLWVFAAMGLLLSAVGIYGATAYAVTRRTRELAIRIAIGAHPASVFRLVTRYGTTVALVGILGGLLGALALARTLSSLLYAVAPTDAVTIALSTIAVLIVTLFACAWPAWRATRVDPMIALRAE